ncbi:gas vesicle protein GvpG [Streptomyces roseicoloratus]|uniref:Gas vesicle protein GvpG n=1 Tax=Streptomyces roseicoloratus TaxID=2508722 RepID=A0ABY9RNG7_9ACTN|nr:gas vesicle protein GvpG [Streptomyces roseicoloratus]WMX43731.1 gas vesicle protein GvpG [Streptomyces roseicoloratus]
MGLVTEIVALPAAPLRGVMWVLDKVVRAAEREYYDPGPVQEALAALERERQEGGVDDEEFEQREQALMRRLEEIRAYQLGQAGPGGA